ncbi:MAG: methylated-DNA--[protein]-cysteine S-methyltransferase [Duncaniella sp.]|nr:methylated-DNA--[protein]-cysteine S-methyltransferase [Duncaniella sp.]
MAEKLRPGRYVASYPSRLGEITLASDGERLVGVWFKGQKHFGSTIATDAVVEPERPELQKGIAWLNRFFAGEVCAEMPEFRLVGTDWQLKVWTALLTIPRGTTATYGTLARQLGSSARAVGNAVGRNPISVIVPCHRVTGVAGLTGYAAGIEIKRQLLLIEKGGE